MVKVRNNNFLFAEVQVFINILSMKYVMIVRRLLCGLMSNQQSQRAVFIHAIVFNAQLAMVL